MTSIIDANPDQLIQWLQLEGFKTQSTVTIKMCLAKQPVRSQNTSQINVSSCQRDSIAMSGKANEH